jgi:hypothetical protein
MSEQNTGWRDISTVPYDEVVLFYTHDGNIVQDFMYDCGTKEMARVYTHWQPLLPPPGEDAGEAMKDARRSSIQSLIQKGIERDEEMRALEARCDELEAATLNVLAHLSAAVSVIKTSEENGNHPSCAYGSDTMYRMAMKDFQKSMEAGREVLRSVVEGGE